LDITKLADDILNCDILLEDEEINLVDLNRIIEIYSNAVEYYESIGSLKYKFFFNKIQ